MTIFHYVSITPLINPLNILLLSDRTFVAPYASLVFPHGDVTMAICEGTS